MVSENKQVDRWEGICEDKGGKSPGMSTVDPSLRKGLDHFESVRFCGVRERMGMSEFVKTSSDFKSVCKGQITCKMKYRESLKNLKGSNSGVCSLIKMKYLHS